MSNWVLTAGERWLLPVYHALHKELLANEILHADETTLMVLREPERQALADELGEDGIRELAQRYAEAYEGCYDGAELDAYIEEICADAYAGMDRLPEAKTQIIQKAAKRAQETQQAAEENGGTRGPPEKYSINNTRRLSWKAQVNGYFSNDGSVQSSDSLYLGESDVDGVLNAPLYIPTSVINKAVRQPKGSRSAHALTKSDIMKLESGVRNAPAVIVNPARNAVVFVTENADASGNYIIASFDLNNNLFGETAHKSTSIHGQVNLPALFENLGADATIFVKNENKLNQMLPGNQILKSLELLAKVELDDGSVAENSGNVNEKFSAAEDTEEVDAEAGAAEFQVEKLPQTNRDQFMRFATKITDDLVTPLTAQMETLRKEMRPRVLELVDEFLENDALKRSSVEAVFTEAYDRALEFNQEFSEKYAALQYAIRKTPVTFTEEDTRQIEQYDYFDEAALRKLTIKEKGGVSIGELYSDLSGMLPELFPSGIKNPAKQIMRIASVYKRISKAQALAQQVESTNPEYFRQNAYNDFLEQLRKIVPKMRTERELAQISIEEEAAMEKAAAERERRLAEEDARLAAEEASKEPPTVYENLTMDSIPKKAQDYLRRVRGQTAAAIQQTLSMPFAARQEVLKPAIEEMMNEYLQTGRISQETVDRSFEESYRRGVKRPTVRVRWEFSDTP